MVATLGTNRRDAPGSDCPGHHAYRTQGIECSALEILAGDVFERLPACPEIDAVADFSIAGDRCNFRIEEVRDHAGDGIGSDDGIGVNADEKFGIADVLQSKVQRLGLASVGLGEYQYFAGG